MKAAKTQDDILILKYVPLKTLAQWSHNTKRHDLPLIIKSFETHGFKDPLKYEPALNNGEGGIVEGNGRDQALKTMFNQNSKQPPRGIVLADGDWMVPVLFGVDAKSQVAAESYGIDHNAITLRGGDLDFGDLLKIQQDEFSKVLFGLKDSGQLPVSVQAEDLDVLLDQEREKLNEAEENLRPKNMLRILISVPGGSAIQIQEWIEKIKDVPGVEIDVSGN